MYFTIYKTVNLLSGKFYIGMHQTENLSDGYIGSGKLLHQAVKKYGIENFSTEILFVLDSADEMYAKEMELVTEELVRDVNCYNISLGGNGGNRLSIESDLWSVAHLDKMRNKWIELKTTDPVAMAKDKQNASERFKKAHREGKIRYDTFTGKTHSDETKLKMSKYLKGLSSGEKNSQFGTMWITDGTIDKKISCESVIPDGWRRGRK